MPVSSFMNVRDAAICYVHCPAIAAFSALMVPSNVHLSSWAMAAADMNEERQIATTTGGAIGISVFASFIGLCCIGPWAVVLFGVSGAVTMARWAPVRPYIVGVAAVMLAWAFWRVYRAQPVCEDGSCATGPSKWLKVMLWVATILVVVAFFADDLQWLLDATPEALRK
jgi:hypothetical protein